MPESKPQFMLLPPKPDVCQECAVDHPPEYPHNRDSLFYQCIFYQTNGRWPTWKDAMAHCDDATKEAWKKALTERGVKIE